MLLVTHALFLLFNMQILYEYVLDSKMDWKQTNTWFIYSSLYGFDLFCQVACE